VAPLIEAAWAYRHNMTAADAIHVALAEHLGADFLTDDHKLAAGVVRHSRLVEAYGPMLVGR
jgi:predicted nucleic acid-binding protein